MDKWIKGKMVKKEKENLCFVLPFIPSPLYPFPLLTIYPFIPSPYPFPPLTRERLLLRRY